MLIVIRVVTLIFAIGLTVFSLKTVIRRYKLGKDTFFDILAFLAGLSMSLHFTWSIVQGGNGPVLAGFDAFRFSLLLALAALFGFTYRRMIED